MEEQAGAFLSAPMDPSLCYMTWSAMQGCRDEGVRSVSDYTDGDGA